MNHRTRYDRIEEARRTLELPESATLGHIKQNYRQLVKKWHPDLCEQDREECKKMMQKINLAYECLMDYCDGFEFSFSREEVEKHPSPEEYWHRRFGTDPMWGSMDRFQGKKRQSPPEE